MARDRELMEWHVDALYTHDAAGRIVRVREHDGAPAPRFFVGRTAEGAVYRCRDDVDDALCRALAAAAAADPIALADVVASGGQAAHDAPYVALLARTTPAPTAAGGPAFSFPAEIPEMPRSAEHPVGDIVRVTAANADVLRPLLPDWLPDVHRSPPLLGLVLDGRAVAVCASVRITPCAHEAGVDTAPAFRGRGYAPRVVAAWAHVVRALGAEPLYSTGWANAASRAVARKLGLLLYGTDLNVT